MFTVSLYSNGRGAVKTSVQAQINTPDPLQQEKEVTIKWMNLKYKLLTNFLVLSLSLSSISKVQTPDLEQQQLEIEAKRKDNKRLVQEIKRWTETRTRTIKQKSK